MPDRKQNCFVQMSRLLGNIKNMKVFFISVNTCESISSRFYFFSNLSSPHPQGCNGRRGKDRVCVCGEGAVEESELSVAIKWFCFSVHSLQCCMTAN